jgi:hypothetical protein
MLQGTDIWLKAGVAFVAVDFILSLPSWALGLVLVLAAAAKFAVQRLQEKERENEDPASPPRDGSDAR